MNITKIESGFTLNGKDYTFKKFVVIKDDVDTEVSTEIIAENAAHVGTDKGIICITLAEKLNNVTYTSIDELVTDLCK